jgi:hypothetical protein
MAIKNHGICGPNGVAPKSSSRYSEAINSQCKLKPLMLIPQGCGRRSAGICHPSGLGRLRQSTVGSSVPAIRTDVAKPVKADQLVCFNDGSFGKVRSLSSGQWRCSGWTRWRPQVLRQGTTAGRFLQQSYDCRRKGTFCTPLHLLNNFRH